MAIGAQQASIRALIASAPFSRTHRANGPREHAAERLAVARREVPQLPTPGDRVDHLPNDLTVPSFRPRMVCTKCGTIDADVHRIGWSAGGTADVATGETPTLSPWGSVYSSEAPNNCRRLKSPNCSCMWASSCAFSSANLIHFSAIRRKVAAAGSGVFRAASTQSAAAALRWDPARWFVICPPLDPHQSSPRSIGQMQSGIFSFSPLRTLSEVSLHP
jgi:hypothetical protein